MIRAARPDEAQLISALALRSKAHWGYPPDFIEAVRKELSYTAEQIRSEHMRFFVLETAGVVVGFHALILQTPTSIELDALFVDPVFIGKEFGRVLIEHAKSIAASLGATQVGPMLEPSDTK